MAVIPALTENADAALGLLTEANSFVDKITGTGAGARIVAGGYDGPRAIEVAPAGSPNINRVDYPATPRLWQSWYIQPETWPSTTPTATDAWYSGNATKVADVRPAADRTLELRSANNSRWRSTPLASNEWHRVAVLIAPNISGTGTLRLRIYSGATRDSMTVSQDSQNRNAAVMVASTDNYRFGCLSPDILRYKRDRFRADDAVEPAGVPAPTPPPDPDDPDLPPVDPVVVTPSTEQVVKPFEPVTVTASSSGGTGPYTHAWSVVSGGPLNIPGATTARRTFVAPARVDGADLVLQVQSTDSLGAVSDPKTVQVTVVPHAEFYAHPDGTLRPVRTALASVVSSPMPSPVGPLERWDHPPAPEPGAGFGASSFGTSPFGG